MVLSWHHRDDGLPVGEGHDRDLCPVEALFNQDTLTSRAEALFLQHVGGSLTGLFVGRGHHNPLPLRQPFGFDHHWQRVMRKVGKRRRHAIEASGRRGRDLMTDHQILGEDFAGLDLSGTACRAENLQLDLSKLIRDAQGERPLRPHHGEINPF